LKKSGLDLSDSIREALTRLLGKSILANTAQVLSWPRLLAQSSFEPRQQHAAGVGLDGDAQRQAIIFKP